MLWLSQLGLGPGVTRYNRHLLLPPFRTALLAVLASGWEFTAEITHFDGIGRAVVAISPHIALLAVVVSLFIPIISLQIRRQIVAITVLLVPMTFVAVIYSGLRISIGLCCCSRSFCPVTFPTGLEPDPAACSLVVKNCYMAFIRKIVHFYGTASLIPALTGVIFTVLAQSPRQTAGRKHCLEFLAKTRIE